MQQILKDRTTTDLIGYPSDISKLWNAASVRVQTPSVALPDAYSAATIDAASKTVNGSHAEGTNHLTLSHGGTDPTNGRKYIIDTLDGSPKFTVTVTRFDSHVAYLQDPLPKTVPSNSTLQGYQVRRTLTAEEVKLEGQGIARWQVTDAAGVAHVWDEPFLVVNSQTNYTLTADSLVRSYPIAERLHAPGDDNMIELIETAWRDYVRPDLEAKQIRANQIKSWERVEAPHAAACVYHLVLTDERQDPVFVEQWRNVYAHQMDLLFASREFWYSEDDPEDTIGRVDNGYFMNRNIGR